MTRPATSKDDRQAALFDDLPMPRPRTSDARARDDMLAMIETLAASRTHPWSARLLGWQKRTFATLAQRLTPLDAAALSARFDSELERLGPIED